jgi:hypothetical protein
MPRYLTERRKGVKIRRKKARKPKADSGFSGATGPIRLKPRRSII